LRASQGWASKNIRECDAVEVVRGIHLLSNFGANVYLLLGERITLVDTGWPGNAKRILSYLSSLGYEPSDVSSIVLTHCHIDHCGGAAEVKERTKATVASHRNDVNCISGVMSYPTSRGILGVALRIAKLFLRLHPVEVDLPLSDGMEVPNSGGLGVIYTPGHTAGSICLYHPKLKVLFSGDTVICEGGEVREPAESTSMNPSEVRLSVRKLSELDFESILPGHGAPIVHDASSRVRNLAAKLETRMWRVLKTEFKGGFSNFYI